MHLVSEISFVRLKLSRIDAPQLIRLDGCHAESFSNEQGQELDINLTTCYNDLEQWNSTWFGKYFFIFMLFREDEFNFSHLESFWQDSRLPSYWITTDCLIQFYCWGIVHNTAYYGSIFWAFCVDCAVQCFDSLLPIGRYTAHNFCWIIESQHFDHDFDMCPHRRFAENPLLRIHVFSLRGTRRLHHWRM